MSWQAARRHSPPYCCCNIVLCHLCCPLSREAYGRSRQTYRLDHIKILKQPGKNPDLTLLHDTLWHDCQNQQAGKHLLTKADNKIMSEKIHISHYLVFARHSDCLRKLRCLLAVIGKFDLMWASSVQPITDSRQPSSLRQSEYHGNTKRCDLVLVSWNSHGYPSLSRSHLHS